MLQTHRCYDGMQNMTLCFTNSHYRALFIFKSFRYAFSLKVTGFLLAILFLQHVMADDFEKCGNNPNARQLAALIINDPGQQRPRLRCNVLLTKVAVSKVRDMAAQSRVTHMDRGGANHRLLKAGYELASIYPRWFDNQVEAIAGGIASADIMREQFKASAAHRTHLLAEHPFYLHQDDIGVAFYQNSTSSHEYYWAVYVAGKIYSGELIPAKQLPSKKDIGFTDSSQ